MEALGSGKDVVRMLALVDSGDMVRARTLFLNWVASDAAAAVDDLIGAKPNVARALDAGRIAALELEVEIAFGVKKEVAVKLCRAWLDSPAGRATRFKLEKRQRMAEAEKKMAEDAEEALKDSIRAHETFGKDYRRMLRDGDRQIAEDRKSDEARVKASNETYLALMEAREAKKAARREVSEKRDLLSEMIKSAWKK